MVSEGEFPTKRGNISLGKIRVEAEFDYDPAGIEQHVGIFSAVACVRIGSADMDARIFPVLTGGGR